MTGSASSGSRAAPSGTSRPRRAPATSVSSRTELIHQREQLPAQGEQRLAHALRLFAVHPLVRGRRLDATLAQLAARARDGEAVRVEQILHLEQRLHVAARVDALALGGLLRADGAKLRLPVAEHVRLHTHEAGDLADPVVELRRKLAATRHALLLGRLVHPRVERVLEDLARLEVQHAALRDDDGVARLGVPALALPLVAQDEVAEAGDLDLLPAAQRLLHRLEDEIHEIGRLLLGKAAEARVNGLHDLRFGHGAYPI